MLDTMTLSLPQNSFEIRHIDRFEPIPVASFILNGKPYRGRSVPKAFCNYNKGEKHGRYYPRLTLLKTPRPIAGCHAFLRIELSVPKILYGNNFVEVRGMRDFKSYIDALHETLNYMGVFISRDNLINAPVSAVHFSKNIMLDRHTPCFLFLKELEKINLTAKLDLSKTEFRNSGQMVKYHANGYEIALYDKFKDLEQCKKYGEKRSEGNDNACQLNLLNLRKPEILRFEIRLQKRKLKQVVERHNPGQMLTNVNFFDENLSRTVLLEYWQIISAGLAMLSFEADNPAELTRTIKRAFPRKRAKTILQMVGFAVNADALSIPATKELLGLKNDQVYQFKKDLSALDGFHTIPRFSVLKTVKRQLEEFIPLTMDDIEQVTLSKTV